MKVGDSFEVIDRASFSATIPLKRISSARVTDDIQNEVRLPFFHREAATDKRHSDIILLFCPVIRDLCVSRPRAVRPSLYRKVNMGSAISPAILARVFHTRAKQAVTGHICSLGRIDASHPSSTRSRTHTTGTAVHYVSHLATSSCLAVGDL